MQFHVLKNTILCLLLSLFLMPRAGFADQLIMKNGDVITGDITRISDGEVLIKPGYSGKFAVEIADVVSIEADKEFAVELTDGSEFNAQFAGARDGEQVLIVDGSPMTVGITDVAEAKEPEDYYHRVSHVDVNATFNGGNTDSQSTLIIADTRLKLGDHRHLAELRFRRDETDGISTKKQDLFSYQYNWLFNAPWYVGATTTFERDPIRDLSHRYTLGALAGRDLLDDSNRFLTISVGAGYSDQQIGGGSDSGSVGLWNLIYEHDFRGGDISFFHKHNLTYQFYGENNAIFKTNTGFQFDIISDIYTKISLRYDYETQPAAGASKNDTTLAIGVGAEF